MIRLDENSGLIRIKERNVCGSSVKVEHQHTGVSLTVSS